MTRHKEFDVDKAIDRATQLFWENGYARTSLSDLLEHLNIGRASFYNAFHDKKTLFTQVVERYIKDYNDKFIVEPLNDSNNGLEGIRTVLMGVVIKLASDPKQLGCLLVNSEIEFASDDTFDDIRTLIASGYFRAEIAFQDALHRAITQGDVRDDLDVEATAKFLLSTIRGLRVTGRVNNERQSLTQIADVAYSVLGAERPLEN